MTTKEKISVARAEGITGGTGLASQVRINKENLFSLTFSFILDEALQLIETPTVKPTIKPFTLPIAFSDAREIFEDDNIGVLDYLFANVVVDAGHITFLPTTQHSQVSFGRLCAFSLQMLPQKSELINPCLGSLKDFPVACDCEVVYSEVNPKFLVATRNAGINLSGESDVPIQYSFDVDEFQGLIFPIKILPIILRNKDFDIFSVAFFEGGYSKIIKSECEKLTIPTNSLLLNQRLDFELCAFQAFAGFTNSLNSKISRKILTNILINQPMQSEAITNLGFEPLINNKLHSSRELFAHREEHFVLGTDF